MCASDSGSLATVTWRDHQASSYSYKRPPIGETEEPAVSRVSSISQYNLDPCLAPNSSCVLEILVKKYRGRVPMDGAVKWLLQGREPGGESLPHP